MSRENFAIKLTGLKGEAVYVNPSQVFHLTEVPEDATKKVPAHTLVVSPTGFAVQVTEKVVEIERRGGSFGIFKVVQ